VAINCAPRARENTSEVVFLFSREARRDPSLRGRERERRLLGFRVQGGGGVPPPSYVDAKSSHTDDKFIHPNSILLFANRRNQNWNFPFNKKNKINLKLKTLLGFGILGSP